MTPAVVYVAPGNARGARLVCGDCGLDETRDRTATAQADARAHNEAEHAFPEPLPDTDPEELR
jgi:hypothetical protein